VTSLRQIEGATIQPPAAAPPLRRGAGRVSTAPRLSRVLGPRPVLLVSFAVVVAARRGTFAGVGTSNQSQSRRPAETRFDTLASVAAQLTASLFDATVTSAQTTATKEFGGRTIDSKALEKVASGANVLYALVLDAGGKTIASSHDTPAPRLAAGAPAGQHVRDALAGQPTISDLLPTKAGGRYALEWALPYKTPYGRRVFVEALAPKALSAFLNTYLVKVRTSSDGISFVLDSNDRIVAAAGGKDTAQGDRPQAASLVSALAAKASGTYGFGGSQRYYASAPVAGSTWHVVLTARTSKLYPKLAGSGGWLLFAELAAFALAGLASLWLFRQALQNGAKLSRANAELIAVNATLEQRVAERTAAAEERATELARSNAELEQFSSVASHDLQEPLRKIRMFGERLRDRLGDGLAEEPAADLARMGNAAERMQRLINDLLSFARVSSRGRDFEPVELAVVAQEVMADLEARVVELDASVELGDLPVIDADPTQMRQLMQNLVGNALKFHREGVKPVVRISGGVVDGREPRFPGEATAGDHCVITVEDNGIGFDEKYAERIFTAFERLHGRSAYEGTGIGLSIARKIVWRHGGDITARGEPDHGATFTVTLPLAHDEVAQGAVKRGAVVLDDEPALLREHEHEHEHAHANGRTGGAA
jgi:signal transduction histidine kinase